MASIPTFASGKRSSIETAVQKGTLTYPSYALCTDTNSLIFVNKELQLVDVKGYNQASIMTVETLPNTSEAIENAFYICNGVGYIFINEKFVPMFKDEEGSNSYDSLTETPFTNLRGTLADPVYLNELDSGNYCVTGHYLYYSEESTMHITPNKLLFIVDNGVVTKLDASEIIIYDGTMKKYATEGWVAQQGYATETFVTEAVNELYQKIAEEILITKVSQLENDAGYLTRDDFDDISDENITNLF